MERRLGETENKRKWRERERERERERVKEMGKIGLKVVGRDREWEKRQREDQVEQGPREISGTLLSFNSQTTECADRWTRKWRERERELWLSFNDARIKENCYINVTWRRVAPRVQLISSDCEGKMIETDIFRLHFLTVVDVSLHDALISKKSLEENKGKPDIMSIYESKMKRDTGGLKGPTRILGRIMLEREREKEAKSKWRNGERKKRKGKARLDLIVETAAILFKG